MKSVNCTCFGHARFNAFNVVYDIMRYINYMNIKLTNIKLFEYTYIYIYITRLVVYLKRFCYMLVNLKLSLYKYITLKAYFCIIFNVKCLNTTIIWYNLGVTLRYI